MKKTLTSLRGNFNRFRTNNPIKTGYGATCGTALTGVLIAPLDMGATLALSGLAIPFTGLFYLMHCDINRSKSNFNHKNSRDVTYNRQRYTMTVAQATRYTELEEKKRKAQKIYNETTNAKLQKKLLKKAQKWSNIQDDLLDGANVFKASEKPTPPPFEVSRKKRTPGN